MNKKTHTISLVIGNENHPLYQFLLFLDCDDKASDNPAKDYYKRFLSNIDSMKGSKRLAEQQLSRKLNQQHSAIECKINELDQALQSAMKIKNYIIHYLMAAISKKLQQASCPPLPNNLSDLKDIISYCQNLCISNQIDFNTFAECLYYCFPQEFANTLAPEAIIEKIHSLLSSGVWYHQGIQLFKKNLPNGIMSLLRKRTFHEIQRCAQTNHQQHSGTRSTITSEAYEMIAALQSHYTAAVIDLVIKTFQEKHLETNRNEMKSLFYVHKS